MKNKYKILSISLFYLSVLMTGIMLIHTFLAYQNYLKHPEYSAPFSVNLIFIIVTYGIPTILAFVLSIVFKKRAINE